MGQTTDELRQDISERRQDISRDLDAIGRYSHAPAALQGLEQGKRDLRLRPVAPFAPQQIEKLRSTVQ